MYAFYGLNKVEVKIADATTTLSGGKLGETLLSSKTEKIVLTQTDKDGNKVTSATLNLSSYNTEASGFLLKLHMMQLLQLWVRSSM